MLQDHKTCHCQQPEIRIGSDNVFANVHSSLPRGRIDGYGLTYFNEHFDGKNHSKYVIGCSEKYSLGTRGRYIRAFHCQCYAIQGYEKEYDIVEPFLRHKPCTGAAESERI